MSESNIIDTKKYKTVSIPKRNEINFLNPEVSEMILYFSARNEAGLFHLRSAPPDHLHFLFSGKC